MRLHIDVLRPKQFLRPLARQVLDDIGILAAAVISLARIAFGILIRENAARGFQHCFRREVLAGDQLELRMLPLRLMLNGVVYFGIDLRQAPPHSLRCRHDSFLRVSSAMHSAGSSFATRRACRPPANSVSKNILTSSNPRSPSRYRAPSVSTLASLCSRVRRTSSSDCAGAARTPATLLAAIAIPMPVEHTRIPRSDRPAPTSRATCCA